jgi:hypothetical protein
MLKNITFAADETLIDEAREAARAENTTLNEQFRQWLEAYARKRRVQRVRETVTALQSRYTTGGERWTREEKNERH